VTRLKREDIRDTGQELFAYDADLVRKTGLSLKGIASCAMEVSEEGLNNAICSHMVAVVPVTSGKGVIKGFVEAVRDILVYIGVNVFITKDSDVAGLAEGIERDADIAFLADDNRFVALNLSLKRVIDNAQATARGYVSALEAMARGLSKREVLVIGGAGQVGWNAVLSLEKKGAKVAIFDPNQNKLEALVKGHENIVEKNLGEALSRYTIFFDASPAADIIQAEHIKPETLVAAPGIPLGLSEEAYSLAKERLIHDPLEIGVASMFVQASCIR